MPIYAEDKRSLHIRPEEQLLRHDGSTNHLIRRYSRLK